MVSHPPVHGGNVHAAARELRRPIGSILDFSASINPLGPSPKAVRALVNAAHLVQHYPDPDCDSLKRAIERRWHIAPERIVVGNGSTELIAVIPRALSIRSAVIVGPTYAEYVRAVGHAGGRISMVMAKKEEEYRPPLEQVLRRLSRQRRARPAIDAVFICHPNSPTGRPCRPQDLHALFGAAERAGVWVVLDESFIEYCESIDLYAAIAFSLVSHHPPELDQILWAARSESRLQPILPTCRGVVETVSAALVRQYGGAAGCGSSTRGRPSCRALPRVRRKRTSACGHAALLAARDDGDSLFRQFSSDRTASAVSRKCDHGGASPAGHADPRLFVNGRLYRAHGSHRGAREARQRPASGRIGRVITAIVCDT